MRNKAWRKNNIDKAKEIDRIYNKKYKETHRAEINERKREYARKKKLYLDQLKYFNV